MKPIKICMLGSFSLEAGDVILSDAATRSRKVWCLLGYLLCCRDRNTSGKKLIELLWGEDSSANPENALRITLHRLRSLLDTLWPGAGRELILHKEGSYCWNREAEITLDWEEFEALSQPGRDDEETLGRYLKALELYQGEFLAKHSSEFWVIPMAAHFHNLFLQMTLAAGELLLARQRYEEASQLCRRASATEPYHEGLHQLWLRILGAQGDPKGAAAVYETLRKRLFEDFGIHPNEQTRQIYRAAAHAPEDRTLPIDEVLAYLQEPEVEPGALVCDYDYFKVLCFAESRSLERSGNATHVALVSLTDPQGDPLSRRSLGRVMGLLEMQLQKNLRRGDTISRCSASQFIIMLPKCNYENGCMVCRRIVAAFHQAHPRTAVKLNCMVQPLTPSICVP